MEEPREAYRKTWEIEVEQVYIEGGWIYRATSTDSLAVGLGTTERKAMKELVENLYDDEWRDSKTIGG